MAGVVSHKLVLLGDTSVGKSCLVVRFCRGEFYDYQEPTIGGEYAHGLLDAAFLRMQPKRFISIQRPFSHRSCIPDTDSTAQRWHCAV